MKKLTGNLGYFKRRATAGEKGNSTKSDQGGAMADLNRRSLLCSPGLETRLVQMFVAYLLNKSWAY